MLFLSIVVRTLREKGAVMKTHPEATLVSCLAVCSFALSASVAFATADGPDYWAVTGVASDDVLNMRIGPKASFLKIGELPPDAGGVANLSCTGEMTLSEWEDASEEERASAAHNRWCLVGYDRVVGWVAGRYLEEGGGEDNFNAGGHLGDLAGSEWQATHLNGIPVQDAPKDGLVLSFKSGGEVAGNSGCNQFAGSYSGKFDEIAFGPLATTRKACVPAVMTLEQTFLKSIGSATGVSAHHLIMVLLDADMQIVASFRRSDPD